MLLLKVAALQAGFGQEKELAAIRKRCLAFAKDTNDSGTAERAAKACSIRGPPTRRSSKRHWPSLGRGVELGKGGQ
jgi:hypothetical protein